MQKPSSNLNRKQPRRSHILRTTKQHANEIVQPVTVLINLGQGKCASLHVRRWCKMQTSTVRGLGRWDPYTCGGQGIINRCAEFSQFLRMSNLCRCVLHHSFMHESSMILLFSHPPPVDAMHNLDFARTKKNDFNEFLNKFSNLGPLLFSKWNYHRYNNSEQKTRVNFYLQPIT